MTKVIIQSKNVNYIDFNVERKSKRSIPDPGKTHPDLTLLFWDRIGMNIITKAGSRFFSEVRSGSG